MEFADNRGGTIEVRQQEELSITCVVKEGKPAATIKWYRKNIEFKPDVVENRVESVTDHKVNAISKITLRPHPDDNGAIYACEGNHPALSQPMRAQVKLSVLCKYIRKSNNICIFDK